MATSLGRIRSPGRVYIPGFTYGVRGGGVSGLQTLINRHVREKDETARHAATLKMLDMQNGGKGGATPAQGGGAVEMPEGAVFD